MDKVEIIEAEKTVLTDSNIKILKRVFENEVEYKRHIDVLKKLRSGAWEKMELAKSMGMKREDTIYWKIFKTMNDLLGGLLVMELDRVK